MKKFLISNRKWVLVTLILSMLFIQTTVSFADPPPQGTQPLFTAQSYNSADGTTTIHTQEATLDAAYFEVNGNGSGFSLATSGLTIASGENSGTYYSSVINSPLAYTTDIVPLWDVDLPAGTSVKLETRLSLDGNTWSDWVESPEAFYPVRDNKHSGHLIWVDSAKAALQFRVSLQSNQTNVSPTFKSLSLTFSDASTGPTDTEIAAQTANAEASATCPVAKPTVVSRTAWGNPEGQNSPRRPATYASVTHVVSHHTATSNNLYQDWGRMVRIVWNYHANTLGWGDVGYNYLIDPNGTIYEGRAGGDDVIGVHDGYNRGSMAIGFIGCYGNCGYLGLTNAHPSAAMLNSAKDLIAWKFDQKDIDAHSFAPYNGLYNVPVIAGGRDVSNTYSPGDNLYNQLPYLRNVVTERINECGTSGNACRVEHVIFDKSAYNLGDTINLVLKLVDSNNAPLGGADVSMEVKKLLSNNQASTSNFDLIDLTGNYTAAYNDTSSTGNYVFKFSASDPTGQKFATCYAERTVSVTQGTPPTATPTPISTVIPPTATPTPSGPTDTVLRPEPVNQTVTACSGEQTTDIVVHNVTDLQGIVIKIAYDPAIIGVIDQDSVKTGVQVELGSPFKSNPNLVVRNEVDTSNGLISFDAALQGDASVAINGTVTLFTIHWQPKSTGTSSLIFNEHTLVNSIPADITHRFENGSIDVTGNCSGATGVVTLQGRSNHSGVKVASDAGVEVQTDAQGSFIIANGGSINIQYPGFLAATAPNNTSTTSDFNTTSLGNITLLGGDLNQDNVINIFDLAQMASRLDSNDSIADLNADGKVTIMDLALVASNYGQAGPLTNWQ